MSGDSVEPSLAPSPREQGRSAKTFKRLENKRRKLGHQKAQNTSVEDGQTRQASRDARHEVNLVDEQDASGSSASKTWTLSERRGGRYIHADPILSPNEE